MYKYVIYYLNFLSMSVLSVNPRFRDLYRDLAVPSHLFLKSDFLKFIINWRLSTF